MPRQTSDRPRRADAQRNIASILDAAVEVLGGDPSASMSEIASAAGVARQTVYAHYPSRETLLEAVAERALAQTIAAIDAAEPRRGAPTEALDRLVTAWWETVSRHARVLDVLGEAFERSDAVHEFHGPVLERLGALIRRGQRSGEFDRRLPAAWLGVAFLGLMHTAADEVAAGRLDEREAAASLALSIPRLFRGEGSSA